VKEPARAASGYQISPSGLPLAIFQTVSLGTSVNKGRL
jgi:hypothetical protein